jgi:glycosyltransferase involved in cell wall biosynthesis
MNNLVSIIVPVYNSSQFLHKCIQSILNQSYKNIEIILVNDGSIDDSAYICDEYAESDDRVVVIHKSNSGLVSARKTGLGASTGEYILYIDGDDWIESGLIKCYLENIIKYDADVVVSSHMVNLEGRADEFKNTLPVGIYNKDRLVKEVYPNMMYTGKFSQFGIFSYSWGKLYKRQIILENQLRIREDITIGEDALCVYPTLLDANKIIILDQPYYHYRQRADSLIKTLRSIDIPKMQNVYDDFKQIFYSKGVVDVMLPQLQYYLLSLLIINTYGPNSKEDMPLYPFDGVKFGDRIVICGGGTFGQHLYKKIYNSKICDVIKWIDERHKHYSKLELPVTGFESIKSQKFDKIIIALIDEDNSNKARLKLIQAGVDKGKIIQICNYHNTKSIQELLLEYKIKL